MMLCELCGRDDEHPDDYGCTRRTVPPDGIVRTYIGDPPSAAPVPAIGPTSRDQWPADRLIKLIDPIFAAYRDPRLPNDPRNIEANHAAARNYIRANYMDVYPVEIEFAEGDNPVTDTRQE